MKIRNLLGLAAIGGVVYAHQKRGGEWTLDGIKETIRGLFTDAQAKVKDLASNAQDKIDDVKDDAADFTKSGTEATGYGSSSYGYGDFNRR